ncbi:site-specific DNA-methyltransferase [Parageobacillus galactosidasius]|uniref:Site-specific DNA-methyltransferase n=1 Tax=Parageobacillus galactosidasius TaxID=883812 RepID=A0A226QMI7_9BACL|nr:site-specific DNA-methyltransferase [Parageobacillus galactosidasius]OXB92609.1 site-specific DNA-methyltransferase [Parageobacillus galactosidasius]
MKTKYEQLISLLEEMFQFGNEDLDFGIYRIMNQKREEIRKFLHQDLLPQVKQAFEKYQSVDQVNIRKELEQLKKNLQDAGVEPETSPKYKALQEQLAQSVDLSALENEVYSHLVTFFSRYYDKGDFISKRKYKKDVYAIPYEGEEVKLYWANADQYYVKTSEYFRDYSFKLPSGRKVHFVLTEASTEQNNNKEQEGKERRFILCEESPLHEEQGELYIRFVYRVDKEKQAILNQQAVERILGVEGYTDWIQELRTLAPTEKNKNRTLLEKHLNDYTSKNTFDYFIHKDLGGFLRRELDFYIKNEIMHLDDLDTENEARVEQYLSKIKVIKNIGHKIIKFLEQIENFQKKLWLKKKFVVETNYCVTLDRVPEELYPLILQNQEQINEWKHLFAIDEIEGDLTKPGYSEPLTVEFLKANPYLIVDTKFFDQDFVDRLIMSFEDIDANIDGLLVESENFQALNLLKERYKNNINYIYIDPPYNTGEDGFVYKDNYRHSSWISMINDRVKISRELMNDSGVLFANIGEEELHNLTSLLHNIFGSNNFVTNIARVAKTASDLGNFFAPSIDFILCYAKNKEKLQSFTDEVDESLYTKIETEGPRKGERYRDDIALYQSSLTDIRKNQKYFIECPDGSKVIPPCSILDEIQRPGDGRWRWTKETYEKNKHLLVFKKTKTSPLLNEKGERAEWNVYTKSYLKDRQEKGTRPRNFLDQFINRKGADLLKKMNISFGYPKPVELVKYLIKISNTDENAVILDFFAGSGTTAHAVINLNRETGSNRKYVLVEMGTYFDTVLKPRIKKAIYSKDWKNGKPVSREGSSHMFKYIRLESYEDTLNNLEINRTEQQQLALELMPTETREEYLLSYMLDIETKGSASLLNLDAFENPFDYKLKISNGTETTVKTIDVVETFNYLLGLTVRQIEVIQGFKVIKGELPTGERALIIWRNLKEKSNEDLERFFTKSKYNIRDNEFDYIYVNGDNHLENIKSQEDTWKVKLIEEEFKRLMFDVQDV